MAGHARVLLANENFAFGEFHCPPHDPLWRDVNWIGELSHVVFPGTSVVIEQAGYRSLLANANHVVFYRRNQRYRRLLHDPRGDRCLFVAVAPALVAELLAAAGLGSSVDDLPFVHGPSRADSYLSVRMLASALRAGDVERLASEELIHSALALAVQEGAGVHRGRRRVRRRRTDQEHERLIEGAKQLLTERASANDGVAEIARRLHVSEFHLCRVFRERTGSTLARYRANLRLRIALERVGSGDPLASIAADAGFASASHFTDTFRKTFGIAPSNVRRALGGGGGPDLEDVLKRLAVRRTAHPLSP